MFIYTSVAKNPAAKQEKWFHLWVRKMPWRRKWQPTPVFLPRESHGQRSLAGCSLYGRKESDMTEAIQQQQQQHFLIKAMYTFYREGNGTPPQYSCLENPMDRGAWWTAVHGVAKSRTRLRDFTFTFMHWRRKWQPTPVLAWKIPGMGQPGGLPFMGSHRVGQD